MFNTCLDLPLFELSSTRILAMRILIVNDTHLGFQPNDSIRKNDAVRMFEYQLNYTHYDLVLHAGDLFDNNQPTSADYKSFYKAMQTYCKQSDAEILSPNEQSTKLLYPFLMIHGNHDEQQVIDMLAMTGYGMNIGSTTDMAELNVYPTIVKHNGMQIAVYGWGYIRDERIYHLFTKDKVIWHKPPTDMFSIVLIHQNRTAFPKRHLPMNLLPSFLNIAIWAHEHFCEPEVINLENIDVLQPGSSIVTALQPNETHTKKGNVLNIISKTEYTLERYDLPNRKFFYKQAGFDCLPNVFEKQVLEMVESIRDDCEGLDYEDSNTWPIIKLLVNMLDEVLDPIHPQRLGKQLKFIANPLTCVSFSKKRKQVVKQANIDIEVNTEEEINMSKIISELAPELRMLPSLRLTDVIETCIRREDKETLNKVIDSMMDITRKRTIELTVKNENNEAIIEQQDTQALQDVIRGQMEYVNKEIQSKFSEMRLGDDEVDGENAEPAEAKVKPKKEEIPELGLDSSSDEEEAVRTPPAKRKIKGAVKPARKRPASNKAPRNQEIIIISSDEDDTIEEDDSESIIAPTPSIQNTAASGRRLPSTWTKPAQKSVRRGRGRKYKE